MRTRLVLIAAALAVAALAPAAQAKTVELKVGDTVDVLGTPVLCVAITSNKQNGIACVLWSKDKPRAPSYGVGLSVKGTASLEHLKADGSSATVIKRKLASRSASKVYKLTVGDSFGMQISDKVALGCRIINVTSTAVEPLYRGTKVSCWLATATTPLPNTWGVSISAKFAGVFHFTATSQVDPNKATMRRQT
jgi:hypothetical protein